MTIKFIEGLIFGTAVSAINYFLTLRILENWGRTSQNKTKSRVTAVFFVRYALNFLTLFLVYKNVPMLVGAAIGLTMVKNILVVKNLIKRKG